MNPYRLWCLSMVLILSTALSFCWGSSGFGFSTLATLNSDAGLVLLLQLRVPRTLTALLVGFALGASGAALQSLFRNPLADPSILGVSSGAALFAQITLFTGWASVAPWSLPLCAAGGALLSTFLLLRLVGTNQNGALDLLILGGVALSQVAVAASALITSLALRDFTIAQRLLAWMLGSLDGRTWMHVLWGLGPVIAGLTWLQRRARALDGLSLGDATAQSLGIDVSSLRREVVVASGLLSGISVAMGGVIGFIGLLAPHWARRLGARKNAQLLPASTLLGGLLVVVADLLSRILIAPAEIQIGILTAALGAPWFILLLHSRLKRVVS